MATRRAPGRGGVRELPVVRGRHIMRGREDIEHAMTTVEPHAAFQRASRGLLGLAVLNLLGGMILLSLDEAHQIGLIGSLAFMEALIKLALAWYVWRGSRVATITAMVILAVSAVFDMLTLLGGGLDAVLRLALVALVLVWLRRALRAGQQRPPRPATVATTDDTGTTPGR